MKAFHRVLSFAVAAPFILGASAILAVPAQAATVCYTAPNGAQDCYDNGQGNGVGTGGSSGGNGQGTPPSSTMPAPPTGWTAPPLSPPAPAPVYVAPPIQQAPAPVYNAPVQQAPSAPRPAAPSPAQNYAPAPPINPAPAPAPVAPEPNNAGPAEVSSGNAGDPSTSTGSDSSQTSNTSETDGNAATDGGAATEKPPTNEAKDMPAPEHETTTATPEANASAAPSGSSQESIDASKASDSQSIATVAPFILIGAVFAGLASFVAVRFLRNRKKPTATESFENS